jgi:hypothetical protein
MVNYINNYKYRYLIKMLKYFFREFLKKKQLRNWEKNK